MDLATLVKDHLAALTAAASIVAAVTAGVFGLVVAGVNAWATARNARLSSRRDYQLKMLEPYLVELDAEINAVRNIIVLDMESVLWTKVHPLSKENCDKLLQRRRASSVATIHSLNARRKNSRHHKRLGTFIREYSEAEQLLNDTILKFMEYYFAPEHEFDALLDSEQISIAIRAMSKFVRAGFLLRSEIERYVFD